MSAEFQSWILVADNPAQRAGEAAAFFGRTLTADADIVVVEPEEGEKSIKIEQVRGLHQLLATRPLTKQGRLVLFVPAEAISLAAQQALLKLLEEPPADTTLALVTAAANRLPETVRSRCQIVRLKTSTNTKTNGLLNRLAEAGTLRTQLEILAEFPADREALKAVLLAELAQPILPTAAGITLKQRALAAYESLEGNTTPQLALDSLLAVPNQA